MGTNDLATWERRWHSGKGEVRPAWRFIFEEIERHVRFEGKEVLELGCGKGSLSFFALKAGAKHVTLVDFSEAALGLAREVFRSEDPRRVTYIRANLLDVNLVKRFDVVMSSGVVEHFSGRELEACARQHVRHSRDNVAICVPSDT
ncbi:MAG: class I SAM-dependent methyltransferase, partial [Candidatus Tectimicrobiota bacterium]